MKKIALLAAVTSAVAVLSSAAYAKDSGFSSAFAENTAKPAAISSLSPSAGIPDDQKSHSKKKLHAKKDGAKHTDKKTHDQAKTQQ